jgi:hypothetical protein
MAVLSLDPALGVEEGGRPAASVSRPTATITYGVLRLAEATGVLFDVNGSKVAELCKGANDVSRLAPGAYVLRTRGATARVVVVK